MNCPDVQRQLADYSAGFVQGRSRQRLQEHIAACDACRERLRELRALDVLMAADRVQADEALVRRVMAAVRVGEVLRRPRWLYLIEGVGPLVAAAALLPVAMAILWRLLGPWLEGLRGWELDVSLSAQPGPAAVLILGMAAVAGVYLWMSRQLAEVLT